MIIKTTIETIETIETTGFAVKHIYFVAETKGSMSSMDLREIEKSKISCAEKLFEQMSTSNVKYGKIDSFGTLMDIVK